MTEALSSYNEANEYIDGLFAETAKQANNDIGIGFDFKRINEYEYILMRVLENTIMLWFVDRQEGSMLRMQAVQKS